DSIFATRDWLEPTNSATFACERLRRIREARRHSARANFISTKAASSLLRSRNSRASPTFQPVASSRAFFALFIPPPSRLVISFPTLPANFLYVFWSFTGILFEYLQNYYGAPINPVYDPPPDLAFRPTSRSERTCVFLQKPGRARREEPVSSARDRASRAAVQYGHTQEPCSHAGLRHRRHRLHRLRRRHRAAAPRPPRLWPRQE